MTKSCTLAALATVRAIPAAVADYSFTSIMEENADTAVRCTSALYLDLALDEVWRRCDKMFDSRNLDADVARAVKTRLRSLMRKLVYETVVFGEGEGPDRLTIEWLMEEKMREVSVLRVTAPARIRRRFVEVVNPKQDGDGCA